VFDGAYWLTSGMRHGSDPLAIAPSDKMTTGVEVTAIRAGLDGDVEAVRRRRGR